jgi:hypothetical protein
MYQLAWTMPLEWLFSHKRLFQSFPMNFLRPYIQKRFKFPSLVPKEYEAFDQPIKRSLSVYHVRNIENDELAAIFDLYGRVFYCKVLQFPHREASHEAVVTMDEAGAKRALESLDGSFLKGEKIRLEMRPQEAKIRWMRKKFKQPDQKPANKKQWKALAEAFDKKVKTRT